MTSRTAIHSNRISLMLENLEKLEIKITTIEQELGIKKIAKPRLLLILR
jgi:hypothetical protein